MSAARGNKWVYAETNLLCEKYSNFIAQWINELEMNAGNWNTKSD